MPPETTGTSAEAVLAVLDALDAAGCRVWLEGGWGVDALAGRQTRVHRDVDLDIDAAQEAVVLQVLEALGYRVETDQRPTRVELTAPGARRVDVHPLTFAPPGDARGDAVQLGPHGERWTYPAGCFTTGRIAGRAVGCLSVGQQITWRRGYELRAVDHADLRVLRRLADEVG